MCHMNIEWNKVTWYSKIVAVVLFVGVFCLGLYLGTRYHAPVEETAPIATSTDMATVPAAPVSTGVKQVVAPSKYAATVSLTSSGFVPKNVQIKAGQVVHFVNTTSASMRIYSNTVQPSLTYKNGFDESHSVGRGGTYDFLFNDQGTWTYYNLDGNPNVTGTIAVQ